MFELIFLIALLIYISMLLLFKAGIYKKYPKINSDNLQSASILVAARNEEKNIVRCLESLDKLKYPDTKLEIIIIDDNSEDRTQELINSFIKNKPRFKTLVTKKEIGNLKGKANAIANGLEAASGEIILTTDADCSVHPNWAHTIVSYYTKDTAMVCGFTTQESEGLFSGMQAVDFIFLLSVASGTINLGKPLSCIGNNMSYRKSAYDEVGGYANVPFSVTEDFQLLMAINKLKKYKIIYPIDKDALVISKPCPDFRTLFWQKKRWGVGGLKSDFIGFSVMFTSFINALIILLLPFFLSEAALIFAGIKFLIDYIFIKTVHNKLKLPLSVLQFLVFELYYLIYVIALPFIVLPNQKIKWKGRTY